MANGARKNMKILVLRHPQEKDKELASAPILAEALPDQVEIRTGLSWANLKKATGIATAEPSRWAVAFLGSKVGSGKVAAMTAAKSVVLLDRHGNLADEFAEHGLEGIILLDGNWSQAKTMWWRNPWMLKLNRLLLKPLKPSLYGKLRREPRKDCLSTLEAAAETLEFLARDKVAADMLRTKFVAKLDEIRSKTSATNSL